MIYFLMWVTTSLGQNSCKNQTGKMAIFKEPAKNVLMLSFPQEHTLSSSSTITWKTSKHNAECKQPMTQYNAVLPESTTPFAMQCFTNSQASLSCPTVVIWQYKHPSTSGEARTLVSLLKRELDYCYVASYEFSSSLSYEGAFIVLG